jgi:hypothetical protein
VIGSYAALLDTLMRLIDGEDTSVSDISTQTLGQCINAGERRLYREVRSRHNEKAFSSVTVTSNAASLPSDFEACSVVHFGGIPLKPVSEEWLREFLDSNPSGGARFFCEAGSSLMFGPAVGDSTAVQGRYFYRIADLTAANFSSNELMTYEPDLFVYAALAESGPYFGAEHMQRIPYWEAKYASIRDRINTNKNRAAYSAGRMTVRPSTPLMR